MVGLSGLEPPTSRLSGVRSNRLSYKPISRRSALTPSALFEFLFSIKLDLSAFLFNPYLGPSKLNNDFTRNSDQMNEYFSFRSP